MLERLLPLTSWGDLLVRAANLPRSRLQTLIRLVRSKRSRQAKRDSGPIPQDLPIKPGDGWDRDDLWRLYWLVDQMLKVSPRWTDRRLQQVIVEGSTRAARADELPLRTVGTNRAVYTTVYRPRKTVKADAAERVFQGDCSSITWAIIDTGIDANHPAFRGAKRESSDPGLRRSRRHRRSSPACSEGAVTVLAAVHGFRVGGLHGGRRTGRRQERHRFAESENDHGTHVAGIIGGDLSDRDAMLVGPNFKFPRGVPRSAVGICPSVSLVDVRVFDDNGDADELNVITALAFVQWLNRSQRLGAGRMIDGVNLSLAVPFAADQFACGWTPVCREADRCVFSGIVVVAAAGNAGFDPYDNQIFGTGVRLASITDPGNTESVITVGATDPNEPHRFGPISLSGAGRPPMAGTSPTSWPLARPCGRRCPATVAWHHSRAPAWRHLMSAGRRRCCWRAFPNCAANHSESRPCCAITPPTSNVPATSKATACSTSCAPCRRTEQPTGHVDQRSPRRTDSRITL